jgi:N4-gp56 family major capsid protein
MPIIGSGTIPASVTTRYTQKYMRAAAMARVYDQLAMPIDAAQYDLETRRGLGSTYTFNFLSDMTPGSTAISETADIAAQILRDATSTITPTSRGEALKWSQLIDLMAYTDFVAARAEVLGRNQQETIEVLATAAALGGDLVSRYAARASLDAGTSTHRMSDTAMWRAGSIVDSLRCPTMFDKLGRRVVGAFMHPDTFFDLFAGGNVVSVALYQDKNILFNGEVGEFAHYKIVSTPFAKVFGAAGAANGTAASYAIGADAKALDKTMTVTTGTNVGSGRLLTIGVKETANTFYPTNERVNYVSGTTTMAFVGQGANGGLRFDHTAGVDKVENADSVYPVAFGTKGSLVKVYAKEVGENGELVGPLTDGLAEQWQSLAYKWYGGYGRVAENYILRGEYSSSLDA